MLKNRFMKIMTALILTALIAGVSLVQNVVALTYNTITVGASPNCSIADYDTDENMGSGGGSVSTGNLYLTWDATHLYVTVHPVTLSVVVYLDTATGGTTRSFGTFDYQIAANGGYDYAYLATRGGGTQYGTTNTSTTWSSSAMPGTTALCTKNTEPDFVQFGIPWDDIGNPTSLTVLVTDTGGTGDNVVQYWPAATGNVGGTSPSFSQGYVFDNLGTGIHPNESPTAITLNSLTARNSNISLMLVAGVLLMGVGAILIFNWRNRTQKIS